MKKRTLGVLAAALLLGAGAAAIAAVGDGGGWRGHGHGRGWHGGGPGQGMRGGQPATKEESEARARERFARLDKNSDGFIDAAEVEAALSEGMGARQAMRGQMGQRLLQRFDENSDGKVTKDEFTNHLKKQFARADLDNDGKITDADLPPMLRGRKVLAGEGGMTRRGRGMGGNESGFGLAWLRGADANKDGVVTLDEALAKGMERFATLDRNKDATIDQADFDALRKENVEYRVKRFIHQYGADKDGKVSREQFFKAAAERFALADHDNDGRIGRGEMGFGRGHGRHGGWQGPGGPGPDGRMRGPGRGPGMMGPGPAVPGGPGAGPGTPERN